MISEHISVFVTVPDEETAVKVAKAVLDSKIAACASMIPAVRSLYWWKGEIQDDSELLLVIKTRSDMFDLLSRKIREIHPYEVPEIIAFPIVMGNHDYLAWIDDNVSRKDTQ